MEYFKFVRYFHKNIKKFKYCQSIDIIKTVEALKSEHKN